MLPESCVGCGACCINLLVVVLDAKVPKEMTVREDGVLQMKRRANGSCVALDPETRKCTIYADRPAVCREFEPEDGACLDALHRLGRHVMSESADHVETVVRRAVEFAKSRGFAAEVRFRSVLQPDYTVYLRPLTKTPDTRAAVLTEAANKLEG